MKISRRNFLKKGLAGTLFLGTATLPQPLQALTTEAFAAAPKRAKRIVLISLDGMDETIGFVKMILYKS